MSLFHTRIGRIRYILATEANKTIKKKDLKRLPLQIFWVYLLHIQLPVSETQHPIISPLIYYTWIC